MKMEQYISQLLYRYQCVTVPGFGAFLTEIQSAQRDESSNAFYPPKKLVSFNSYLKNNDGLLASHISQMEKTSYETAVQDIQKEVSLWKNALLNNQSIVLQNIGTVSLNHEGSLVFEASNHINYHTAAFGLASFVSPLVKREIVQESPVFKENEPIVLIPDTATTRSYSYLKYAAVFVVGLGIAGIFGANIYEERVLEETKLVQTEVQKEVEDRIQEATFFIESPLPNVKLTVKEQKLSYHIVAGAFREESNAQRIFERLSKEGFKSRRLEKNKFGLFPVLYGSYATYVDSQKAMAEIHKTQNMEAWLLIKDL